jgi:hypothetical protein
MTQYSIPKDYTLLDQVIQHTNKPAPYDVQIVALFALDDKITFTTNKPFPANEYDLLQLTEL